MHLHFLTSGHTISWSLNPFRRTHWQWEACNSCDDDDDEEEEEKEEVEEVKNYNGCDSDRDI